MKPLLHLLVLAALVGCRSTEPPTSAESAPSGEASAAPATPRDAVEAPAEDVTDSSDDAVPVATALPEIRYFMIADT